jgi:hypothetical protein
MRSFSSTFQLLFRNLGLAGRHFLAWVSRSSHWFPRHRSKSNADEPDSIPRRPFPTISVPRHGGPGNPPPLHWKPCNPSTASRFKALLSCPDGHLMTLTAHMIESNGTVRPSVVCHTAGCGFHSFLVLTDWAQPPLRGREIQVRFS